MKTKEFSAVNLLERELLRVEKKIRFRRSFLSALCILLSVAAITVLLSVFVFPVMRIHGTSMKPTLNEGEIVISLKTSKIDRGDIAAFYYGNKVLIKRCIGVSGDVINIDEEGSVYLNGECLQEPYISEKAFGECDIELPCQVPEGRIFVLGDERMLSIDSRNSIVGFVASEQIIGKIVFRIWPLGKIELTK